jgi:4-amino-4-deoxy-L-arabinose transferase-like glycosyltransferase
MQKRIHRWHPFGLRLACWFATLGVMAWAFIPKLSGEGLFMDGLVYASIARNMAHGVGAFWRPYFSETFWLPAVSGPIFHEAPPLQFWMQSLLFAVLGEGWYVEKLFSAGCLLAAGGLLVVLWNRFFPRYDGLSYAWLPLALLCTSGVVRWGFTNNLLDVTMGTFDLLALWLYTRAQQRGQPVRALVLLGGGTLLAFLTKGPVGLYPLLAPATYHVLMERGSVRTGLRQSLAATAVWVLSLGLLSTYGPARTFLGTYLSEQVLAALLGRREAAPDASRTYVFRVLWSELRVPLLAAMGAGLTVWRRTPPPGFRAVGFWAVMALAASVPIGLSPKQYAHYLLPALPLYSLALAGGIAPALAALMQKPGWRRLAMGLCVLIGAVGLAGTGWYLEARRNGRSPEERAYLADVRALYEARIVPWGAAIRVRDEHLRNPYLHAFLGRYCHAELTGWASRSRYLLLMKNEWQRPGAVPPRYEYVPLPTRLFRLYQAK